MPQSAERATLKKYVAKKRPKARSRVAGTLAPPPAQQDVQYGKCSRAREAYHVFAAVQQQHGKWVVPYGGDRRAVACFQRLARQLERFEEHGVVIDLPLFMQAQKEAYGGWLRAYHLVSPYALDIYQSALAVKLAKEVILTSAEQRRYDDDIVAYLSEVREEPVDQVRELLERSGFF